MKLSAGDTYRDAVVTKPIVGIVVKNASEMDRERLNNILNTFNVVINYKQVQNKTCRFYWKRKGPFCYYVIDRNNDEKPVTRKDKPEKQLTFKSIRATMEWIYLNDMDYYNGLENLSLKGKGGK